MPPAKLDQFVSAVLRQPDTVDPKVPMDVVVEPQSASELDAVSKLLQAIGSGRSRVLNGKVHGSVAVEHLAGLANNASVGSIRMARTHSAQVG